MIKRIAPLALFALVLVHAHPAAAQYTNKIGNVVGTIGGACNSTTNDYGWPDTNGNILKCVSNVWTLVTRPVAAAGSTGYVQFNNSGALAGSANLFWNNSSGYLGIGTATPSFPLDIQSSAANQLRLENTSAGSGASAYTSELLYNNLNSILHTLGVAYTGSNYAGPFWTNGTAGEVGAIGTYGSYPLTFGTNSTQQMIITSSGTVGIGTTAPPDIFDIYSNSAAPTPNIIGDGQGVSLNVTHYLSSTSPSFLELQKARGSLASPTAVAAADFIGSVTFTGYDTSTFGAGAKIISGAEDTFTTSDHGSYLAFYTNTDATTTLAEKMRITGAGNVGIGTTAPGRPLEISGSSAVTAVGVQLADTEASGVSWSVINGGVGPGTLSFKNDTTGGASANYFVINSSGNVGIGTTAPQSTLSVNGGMAIGTTYAGANAAAANNIIVQGKVGVGTASPQSMIEAYNGEVQIGSSGASCTTANTGALRYYSGTLYACNGTSWATIINTTCVTTPIVLSAPVAGATFFNNTGCTHFKIEVVGGGGGGGGRLAGGGGGGGYSAVSSATLNGNSLYMYTVGTAGSGGAYGANSGTAGGASYFCNSISNCASVSGTAVIVGANGGSAGQYNGAAGAGASATGAVGSTTAAGGNGGSGNINDGGGGGGGAGGPIGAGENGGSDCSSCTATTDGGGGGGGANGGSSTAGAVGSSTAGGAGGNGTGGSGGGIGATTLEGTGGTGSNGGGGGGGRESGAGGAGGVDSTWSSLGLGLGGGGGGAGGDNGVSFTGDTGGAGGSCGGGGGGGGYNSATEAAGGNGGGGCIIITPLSMRALGYGEGRFA